MATDEGTIFPEGYWTKGVRSKPAGLACLVPHPFGPIRLPNLFFYRPWAASTKGNGTMSPDEKPLRRAQPIEPEDDGYAVSEPAPTVDRLQSLLPVRKPVVGTEQPPPPTDLPWLKGVLNFPFYLHSIGACGVCGIALSVSFLAILFAMLLVAIDPMIGFALRLSIGWAITLCWAYVSVCFLTIVEETQAGYDVIRDWPVGDWREWAFSLFSTVGALLPAGMVALGARWFLMVDSPLVFLLAMLASHPILLLSTIDNGSPLKYISLQVLGTLLSHWWCWAILYAILGTLLALWAIVFLPALEEWPWHVAALSGPPLAAILFIYARLLGRLIWQVERDRNPRRKTEA